MKIPNRKKSAEMILEIIHTTTKERQEAKTFEDRASENARAIQEEIEKQRKNGRFTTIEQESKKIPTGRITVLCIHIILTTFLQAIDKALPYIIAILAYKHL